MASAFFFFRLGKAHSSQSHFDSPRSSGCFRCLLVETLGKRYALVEDRGGFGALPHPIP